MKKIFAVFVLAVAVGFALIPSQNARAGITDYTVNWNITNFYDTDTLAFVFTGLDVSSSYRWTVQMVDTNNGEPFIDVGHYTHVPGTASDGFIIGPGSSPILTSLGDWPFEFTGPVQVKDNWGQIIFKGFLAPHPDLYFPGAWESGTGNNAYVDKVVAGRATHVSPVFNAVYNDVNADGWHYQKNRFSGNSIIVDDFGLMHFNLDCATFVAGGYTTERFKIYTFAGTEIADIHLNELLNYQQQDTAWPPASCTASNSSQFESFVVLNTSGDELPFINNTRANLIFTAGANPHTLDIAPGAYYIQKRDAADAHVADGEAPLLITENGNGVEWSIEIGSGTVSAGGNQTMIFKASTVSLWDNYHGASLCQDNSVTWQDLTTYSFTTARPYSNLVAGSPVDNDFIECVVNPLTIGTVTMTATHAQVIYESPFYDVIAGAQTFDESINQLISAAKLNTENGKNLVFVIILALGILLVTAIPVARKNTFTYLIVWTGIGGAWVVAGPATALGITMWALITVVLWLLVLSGNQGGGQIDESP